MHLQVKNHRKNNPLQVSGAAESQVHRIIYTWHLQVGHSGQRSLMYFFLRGVHSDSENCVYFQQSWISASQWRCGLAEVSASQWRRGLAEVSASQRHRGLAELSASQRHRGLAEKIQIVTMMANI